MHMTERIDQFASALDILGVSGRDRDIARGQLIGAVWSYAMRGGPQVNPSEIQRDLEIIERACTQIDAARSRLAMARRTASLLTWRGALGAQAFAATCDALADRELEWDERNLIDDPLAGRFARAARRIGAARAEYDARIDSRARQVDQQLLGLIADLATTWEDFRGKPARCPDNSTLEDYRAPFARFVDAVWCLVSIEPPPSSGVIRRSISIAAAAHEGMTDDGKTLPSQPGILLP